MMLIQTLDSIAFQILAKNLISFQLFTHKPAARLIVISSFNDVLMHVICQMQTSKKPKIDQTSHLLANFNNWRLFRCKIITEIIRKIHLWGFSCREIWFFFLLRNKIENTHK